MKLKKNLAAAVLATAMVASLAAPAFAADGETATKIESGKTTVKYEVEESYQWTVPAVIDFGTNAGVGKSDVVGKAKNNEGAEVTDGNKVSVTKNVIAEGKKLRITAKGSGAGNAFTVQNGEAGKQILSYTITRNSDSQQVAVEGKVLDVASGTDKGSETLIFKLTTKSEGSEVAGKYEGTVTYTAAVVDQSKE